MLPQELDLALYDADAEGLGQNFFIYSVLFFSLTIFEKRGKYHHESDFTD